MRSFFLALSILSAVLLGACAPPQSFDSALREIVQPYRFSLFGWEVKTLPGEARSALTRHEPLEDEVGTVLEYFSLNEQIRGLAADPESPGLQELREQRDALAGPVERILEKQIREVLSEQGIYNPAGRGTLRFPPVNFKLDTLPRLLVISPRERIESIREVTLKPDMTLSQIEALEAEVDGLGVSSLVVGLGGFAGSYPTLVSRGADLAFTLDAAVEEWLHQYLAFRPLGFRYLLDRTRISRSYEIATLNETVVGIAAAELGRMVLERYYPDEAAAEEPEAGGFDFNAEMREIRRSVDAYLARGEVDAAEAYMQERRQYLAAHGHYIRKLNQAYFAFNGAYAAEPTAISPIGAEVRQLREQSGSLRDFLAAAGGLNSRQDLQLAIGKEE